MNRIREQLLAPMASVMNGTFVAGWITTRPTTECSLLSTFLKRSSGWNRYVHDGVLEL